MKGILTIAGKTSYRRAAQERFSLLMCHEQRVTLGSVHYIKNRNGPIPKLQYIVRKFYGKCSGRLLADAQDESLESYRQ
jgi:hypothetical protein